MKIHLLEAECLPNVDYNRPNFFKPKIPKNRRRHKPFERVFALSSEKVDVVFELKLKYKVLVYRVRL